MPMVAGFLGDNLIGYEIEKASAEEPQTIQYPLAIGYFTFRTSLLTTKLLANISIPLWGDFKNYTNIQPTTIQKSEIQQVIPTKK